MRNLKKLLAVIVAICVLATFTVPAFAETSYTYGTQAQTLHDLGLYAGITNGTFTPDLGTALDRQTGVVLLLRVFGLESKALALTDAEVTAAFAGFTDAGSVADWAKKQMAYAIANKLVAGMTTTTIGPKGALNGKMYASLILRQLGFTDAAYDTATTTLSEKGGLTADEATEFATKALIKDDLVGITYGTLKAKDTAGKTVIENLVAGGVVTADAAKAAGLISGEITATVAATGAKKITVTFNQAIDTTKATFVVKRESTTLNVASVTFADDKKSAVINTAGKLLAGDYTVTVKGLTTTDIALTITGIKDEAPTKLTLTGTQAAAVKTGGLIKSATIGYKVLNQYGEDITKDPITPVIKWNSTLGNPDDNNGSGTVTLKDTPDATLIGQSFVLTGVLTDQDNGVAIVVTETLTIGNPAALESITFDGVYNEDGKKLATDSDFSTFAVIISSAQDQYGNDMSAASLNDDLVASVTNPSIIKNLSAGFITDKNGASGDKLGIILDKPTNNIDGTATIRLISKNTGKSFTFDVTVAKQIHVESIKLLAPANVVATKDDVEIPFNAVDQNGATVTDYDVLFADVKLVPGDEASKATSGYLRFEHDYVKDIGVLKFKAPESTGSVVLMSLLNNGKTSQLTLNIKDSAKPTYIAGVTSDIVPNVAKLASFDIKKGFVNVNDNYDRSYDIADDLVKALADGPYRILVKCDSPTNSNDASVDSKVTISGTDKIVDGSKTLGYAITNADGDVSKVTVKGTAKGTTTIDLVLQHYVDTDSNNIPDAWKDVDGSTYSLKVGVVDKADIKSYTIDPIGTLFDQSNVGSIPAGKVAADYNKDVTVYGVKVDGSKVTMSINDYYVDTDDAGLTASGKTLTASGIVATGDDDATVNVIVTIAADGVPQTLTQKVTVSAKAPKPDSIKIDTGFDKSFGKYESEGLVSAIPTYDTTGEAVAFDYNAVLALAQNAVIVKDQYGVELSDAAVTKVIVTNLGDGKTINGVNLATATNLKKGDTFNVIALAGGQNITFKVVLK